MMKLVQSSPVHLHSMFCFLSVLFSKTAISIDFGLDTANFFTNSYKLFPVTRISSTTKRCLSLYRLCSTSLKNFIFCVLTPFSLFVIRIKSVSILKSRSRTKSLKNTKAPLRTQIKITLGFFSCMRSYR